MPPTTEASLRQALKFVNFISTLAHPTGDEPTWHGYFYTAVLSVSAVLAATCDSQYWYRMTQLGLGVRTALSSAIYRKSLRLSNKARGSYAG